MHIEVALSEIHKEENSDVHDLRAKLYATLCHKSGTFITKKRIAIIDVICSTPDFIHVEDLWMKLRKDYTISRAAVYKVIHILVEQGIVIRQKQNFGYTYRLVY